MTMAKSDAFSTDAVKGHAKVSNGSKPRPQGVGEFDTTLMSDPEWGQAR
jgi:hypothetical protein